MDVQVEIELQLGGLYIVIRERDVLPELSTSVLRALAQLQSTFDQCREHLSREWTLYICI